MADFYQSEKCFRRYEKIIAKALENYPESVRFKSSTRSNTTDASRCGNAITAYKRNKWPVTNPFFDLIEERPLKTWIEKDYCVIGPGVNREADVCVVTGVGEGVHGALSARPLTAEHVKTLMHFLNDGIITNPIEIPKIWLTVVEAEANGMLNLAYRIESTSIILF